MKFRSQVQSIFFVCLLVTFGFCLNANATGFISGTITDASTTSAIQGVSVDIYDATGMLVTTAGPSDVSGNYTSIALNTGTYYAVTKNSISYQEELFDNLPCLLKGCDPTTGTVITVVDSLTTTADIALDLGGTITGNIIDEMTITPLSGKHVHVHHHMTGFIGFSQLSDASGNYTTGSGLPTDDYHIVCHNLDDYLHELWDNMPCGSNVCHHEDGDIVSLTAGSSTGGIDFALMFPAFFDKFDDGIPPNWTFKKGTWSETGGFLTGSHTKKASAIADLAFPAGCSANCTVEAFMSTMGNQVPGVDNKLYLFGWWIDKKNRVEVIMNEQKDKWVIKHKVNGTIGAKASFIQTIDPFVLYHVRINFNGTDFHVFIDGTEVMMMPMAPGSAPSGTVGFQLKATTASFDGLLVYPDTHP